MVIIKRCILHYYFQLHVSATSFGAIFSLNYSFLRKQGIEIYNSIVNFIHCLLKKIESSLKMAPKERAETCSWK